MDIYFEDIPKERKSAYPFRCFMQYPEDDGCIHIGAHWHTYIELLYLIDGNADIYLSGQLHKAKKNDLVIINSREAHRIYSDDDSTNYIVMQFDPTMLHVTSTVFALKYVLPFTGEHHEYPRMFTAEQLVNTNIPGHIKNIRNEVNGEDYAYELAVQASIISLFLEIVRNWHNNGIDLEEKTFINAAEVGRFREALEYIESNYMNDISAKDVAQVCGMSYNYFTTRFKQTLGHTFSQHLNFIRLRQSEYQLIATDKSVTEVAYECGFSSTSYYISQFSHYKGITPKKYKRALKTQKSIV